MSNDTSPLDTVQPSELVPVENLDQFVQQLVAWHGAGCQTVQHLLTVPEGSAFEIGEGAEAKTIVLTGDVLEAFKLGIEMALMQLGTLPFAVEYEAEAPVPPG